MNNIDNKILNEIIDKISNSVLYRIKKRNLCENNLIRELSPHCDIIDEYVTHNLHSDNFYIVESNGLFDNYHIIINDLYNEIVKKYNETTPQINNLGFNCWDFVINKTYNDTTFVFFKSIEINVSLIAVTKKYESNIPKWINGGCSVDININDNKIEQVKIKVVCPFLANVKKYNFETNLKSSLAHELTHAYQDLHQHLQRNNSKKVITNSEYGNGAYEKYIDFTKSNNKLEQLIGTIFYNLSKSEKNAKIAQTYDLLKQFTIKELKNDKSITIIQKLPMWNEFLMVDEMINDLYDYSNYDGYDEIILNAINKCCYKMKFTTVDAALKWVDTEYRNTKKNIIRKVGMIMKRYLRDNSYYPIQPKNNSFI